MLHFARVILQREGYQVLFLIITTMGTLNYNIAAADMVYGTVNAGGVTLVSLAATGFTGVEQVAKRLREAAGRFLGLGSISIRNKSQGWTIEMPIATAVRPRS